MLKLFLDYLLPILTVIIAFSRGVFFMPIPQIAYYAFFTFLSCYIFLRSKTYNVNVSLLLMVFIAICSILGNNINAKFMPWQRFSIFIIMILPISSILSSEFTIKFRAKLYKVFLRVLAVIITLSFIGYLSQLGWFYHQKTGTFRGLMIYCMVLGPYAGISSVYLVIKFLSSKEKLYLIAAIASILVCLLSGSRGAIVSLLCAIVYLLAIFCKGNLRLLIKIYLSLVIVTILASPILVPYTETVRQKQENNMRAGGTFSSREALFNDRILEFRTSPFLGSGFASVNKEIASSTPVNDKKGIVEPGSSWLFILSSMGIIAFLAFVHIVINPIIYLYKISGSSSYNYMMIGSALVLFAVHMIIEGYILSAGSFLFWGAWLCIGIAQKDTIEYISNEKYSIL